MWEVQEVYCTGITPTCVATQVGNAASHPAVAVAVAVAVALV